MDFADKRKIVNAVEEKNTEKKKLNISREHKKEPHKRKKIVNTVKDKNINKRKSKSLSWMREKNHARSLSSMEQDNKQTMPHTSGSEWISHLSRFPLIVPTLKGCGGTILCD